MVGLQEIPRRMRWTLLPFPLDLFNLNPSFQAQDNFFDGSGSIKPFLVIQTHISSTLLYPISVLLQKRVHTPICFLTDHLHLNSMQPGFTFHTFFKMLQGDMTALGGQIQWPFPSAHPYFSVWHYRPLLDTSPPLYPKTLHCQGSLIFLTIPSSLFS